MGKVDKIILRRIKESGNYSSFLKLKTIKGTLFERNSMIRVYRAIKNPSGFYLEQEKIRFEDFLEKNGIKFCF